MAHIRHLSEVSGIHDEWVIDGVLSKFCLMWGKPGLGKSFVAISMAASVATGRPWLGRKTIQGRVVYVAGEGGEEAIARRMRAALAEWSLPEDEDADIDIITPGIDLTAGPEELLGLVQQREVAPVLIVVDTLARCFSGDENKQEFMGRFVRSLDLVRDEYPNSAILVVHHANRNEEIRGSSALPGAVDCNWRLIRRKGDATYRPYQLVPDKLKERDVVGAHLRFVLKTVECYDDMGNIELDSFGDVQTSLIVKPDPKDIETARKVRQIGETLLTGHSSLHYIDWRHASGMGKADFDAALSIIVTYPGDWGGIEHLGDGVYGRKA